MGFESILAVGGQAIEIPIGIAILLGVIFVLVIVSTMRRNKQEAMRKEYWAKKMKEKEAEKQNETKS